MKLYCRSCEKMLEVKPDELIGRYFVCSGCRSRIRWEASTPDGYDGDANGERAERSQRIRVD